MNEWSMLGRTGSHVGTGLFEASEFAGFSRMPVLDGGPDDIAGFVHPEDEANRTFTLEQVADLEDASMTGTSHSGCCCARTCSRCSSARATLPEDVEVGPDGVRELGDVELHQVRQTPVCWSRRRRA